VDFANMAASQRGVCRTQKSKVSHNYIGSQLLYYKDDKINNFIIFSHILNNIGFYYK